MIRTARGDAGFTQRELARRAATSQPTLAAYERGAKEPSVRTLVRVLAAAGARISLDSSERAVVTLSAERLRELSEILAQVVEFAEGYPPRTQRTPLRYPVLKAKVSRP